MTHPSKRRPGKATRTPAPTTGVQPRQRNEEGRREAAEVLREQAERARALAEEGRELAEEMRRGADLLRDTGANEAAQHSRRVSEAASQAQIWFAQQFETLSTGITEMGLELKRLRREAAELRRMHSDMQEAVKEQQIISAEVQASQRRMQGEGGSEFRSR